jgi:hypothetical protein
MVDSNNEGSRTVSSTVSNTDSSSSSSNNSTSSGDRMLDELEKLLLVDGLFDVLCCSTRAIFHWPHHSNDRQQTTDVSWPQQ